MSDNFKILGVGGAGVNVVKALGYRNSSLIDSYKFSDLEGILGYVGAQGRGGKVVIVSSPAGEFSSSVLRSVCNVLNSNGNKVFLIGIMPFHSESPERKKRGDVAMRDLRKVVETTAIVENENFASSMGEYSWTQVMTRINEHIGGLVKNFVSQDGEKISTKSHEVLASGRQVEFTTNVSTSMN